MRPDPFPTPRSAAGYGQACTLHVLRAVTSKSLSHQSCPRVSPPGRPGEQSASPTSSSCKTPKRASGPPDRVRESGPEGCRAQSRAAVCRSTRHPTHPNLTAAPEGASAGPASLYAIPGPRGWPSCCPKGPGAPCCPDSTAPRPPSKVPPWGCWTSRRYPEHREAGLGGGMGRARGGYLQLPGSFGGQRRGRGARGGCSGAGPQPGHQLLVPLL